jgi:hypothetical protein
MTIEEGTGDEFLLICFVCKNPFGLVAQFCGYCQATRQQALGVERARPNQQIVDVVPTQPKVEPQPKFDRESKPVAPPPPIDKTIFIPSGPQTKPPQKRQKTVKKTGVFQENLQLRIKSIDSWQKRNSKLISTLGLISFVISAYFSTQSIIFSSSSPENAAQQHLQLGVTRDSKYFEGFPDNSGIRFFPSRYSAWDDSSAGNWVTATSWNGWKGSATVNFSAGGTSYSGISVTAKYNAEYESFLGIFRKAEWKSEAPATMEIEYPRNQQLSIYINGLAAGTVSRPAVSEGSYQMYPGEFSIQFFDLTSGEEVTSLSRTYYIDAYGTYDLNLN